MSTNLLDESVSTSAREAGKSFCQNARKRNFSHLRHGASGVEVIKCLKRYNETLLKRTSRIFSKYSKYFLLNRYRRLLAIYAYIIMTAEDWEEQPADVLWQEIAAHSWLCARITLAILKYGNRDPADMQHRPTTLPGYVSVSHPTDLTREDAVALVTASYIMMEYDEARYRMKRAGKGGRFIWRDRQAFDFDIVLDGDTKALVKIFDHRSQTHGNLLTFAGTWAPVEIYNDFPLPGGFFTPLNPFPQAEWLKSGLMSNRSVILTLIPNIAGQGEHLGWPFRPVWLFQWFALDPLLPRVELFRGLFKKHLQLVRRRPGYELEDLFFVLSAITQYQINMSCKTEEFWTNIFANGYTVISSDEQYLKQEILSEFRRVRRKYGAGSTSEQDWLVMNAVLDDIRWDQRKCKDINLLKFSPVNLIYPVDESRWIIDWTLMEHTIFDLTGLAGRMTGSVARLRGHEVEEVLGEFLVSKADEFGISIWWRGRRDGRLRFISREERDADIALLVDNCLIVVEVKARAFPRDLLIVGDPKRLNRRWKEVVQADLDQVDTLSELLQRKPIGLNFQIPDVVDWIVPLVCTTACEWIPSKDRKWWLFDDMPRACTALELMELISRVKNGILPSYRLPVTT